MNSAALAGLALLAITTTAQAGPVDVTYTVSGSTGNWVLDFSVTNSLVGNDRNDLYLFGIRLPTSPAIVGSPSGWTQPVSQSVSWFGSGGSATNYNNIWITTATGIFNPTGQYVIHPGHTLGGFQATSTDLLAPPDVNWFAVEVGYYPTLLGCNFNCSGARDNAGFEGLATLAVATAVPEPGTLALLAVAMGALALRRRAS